MEENMVATKMMNPSSETENKLRWRGDVKGTPFDFYIPKSCVPEPWPVQIIVLISNVEPGTQTTIHRRRNLKQPIIAFVKFDRSHTRTARYKPEGDDDLWEIGKPYIPYEILDSVSPGTVPERLRIEVVWDYTAGTWEDRRRVRHG
jgi:hypothetical protein